MKKFVTFVFIILLLMVTSAVFADDGSPPPIDDDIPPSTGIVIDPGPKPVSVDLGAVAAPPQLDEGSTDNASPECSGSKGPFGNWVDKYCHTR